MYSCIDFDNSSSLGSLAAYQAFESCLSSKPTVDQSFQRLVHPAVSTALYGTSTPTNFGLVRTWIDCNSPTTPHYGIRYYFTNNVGTVLTAQFDITYIIGFRNNV